MVQHIQQGRIVLIDDDHDLLAGLLVGASYQTFEYLPGKEFVAVLPEFCDQGLQQ